MAATDSTTGAISNVFDTTPSLNGFFVGGLWEDEIPEGYQMPFAAQEVPTGIIQWDSGGFGIEQTEVKFMAFGETAATAEAGATKLMTIFDAVPPIIVFGTGKSFIMSFLRSSPPLPKAQEIRSPNGEIVFGAQINYAAQIQRQR